MCSGTLVHFWCPCLECHFNIAEQPYGVARFRGFGHKILRTLDSGAYIWCDDYFTSPSFRLLNYGPPNCPGQIRYDGKNIRSTTLCDDCVRNGCTLEWRKRSMYGWKGWGEISSLLPARTGSEPKAGREAGNRAAEEGAAKNRVAEAYKRFKVKRDKVRLSIGSLLGPRKEQKEQKSSGEETAVEGEETSEFAGCALPQNDLPGGSDFFSLEKDVSDLPSKRRNSRQRLRSASRASNASAMSVASTVKPLH
ncbi:hypothetical protein VTK56DRAFT_6421 [Thermocarpiscus australiensis]